MVIQCMIPIYSYLIIAGSRTLETIPTGYRTPVAEYMAAQTEQNQ
jgi:hypothetical protein